MRSFVDKEYRKANPALKFGSPGVWVGKGWKEDRTD